ncbi:uncharacterized protein LOC111031915 [Myzus persicae]|uniref:uncharacterized protein LOC111031915 n=1 Tax=Myzus persicae TaxID=13164 RepID=UPI000B9358EC|nr:uncharacterized protein LOC111031915 [Myzus persicae]
MQKIRLTISNKLNNVLMKNNGFKVLKNISAILDGENTTRRSDGIPEDQNLNDMVHFKYAPVTSVDVGRSFSSYKNILCDHHRGSSNCTMQLYVYRMIISGSGYIHKSIMFIINN